MYTKANRQALWNTLLFTTGVFAFAWFIHSPGWTKIFAWAGFLLICMLVYRHTLSASNLQTIFHDKNSRYFFVIATAGVFIGAGFGIYYRIYIGASPIPQSISWFAPVAVFIGLTEEFVFRGLANFLIKKWSPYITIPITALLHASYKTLLFLQPNTLHPVDTHFLFTATFIAGLILGMLQYIGRSVLAPMAAHGTW
ncbi:MAG: CPBP family intramembrane metalloprotease, partial [Chitinophagaceae bacterium]|nr:CPBP family intramembrane metalloprotease [Chitinophagaceae bacterium]